MGPERQTINKKLIGFLKEMGEMVPLCSEKRMAEGKKKLLEAAAKKANELTSASKKKEEEGQEIGENLPPQ